MRSPPGGPFLRIQSSARTAHPCECPPSHLGGSSHRSGPQPGGFLGGVVGSFSPLPPSAPLPVFSQSLQVSRSARVRDSLALHSWTRWTPLRIHHPLYLHNIGCRYWLDEFDPNIPCSCFAGLLNGVWNWRRCSQHRSSFSFCRADTLINQNFAHGPLFFLRGKKVPRSISAPKAKANRQSVTLRRSQSLGNGPNNATLFPQHDLTKAIAPGVLGSKQPGSCRCQAVQAHVFCTPCDRSQIRCSTWAALRDPATTVRTCSGTTSAALDCGPFRSQPGLEDLQARSPMIDAWAEIIMEISPALVGASVAPVQTNRMGIRRYPAGSALTTTNQARQVIAILACMCRELC